MQIRVLRVVLCPSLAGIRIQCGSHVRLVKKQFDEQQVWYPADPGYGWISIFVRNTHQDTGWQPKSESYCCKCERKVTQHPAPMRRDITRTNCTVRAIATVKPGKRKAGKAEPPTSTPIPR